MDAAVIFDVDGVLLELTKPEEEVFFESLASRCDTHVLSRDWNSYAIRNDENIIEEILARNGRPAKEKLTVIEQYLGLLKGRLYTGEIETTPISGAGALLEELADRVSLGIATANLLEAARVRLHCVGFWEPVAAHAHGADGGGHKHEILARALAGLGLPRERIVYIGDNTNDVEAGLKNGVHFIGFSLDAARRRRMQEAGARHLSASHAETRDLIRHFLGLE
jgi:phosphoglycolate phosphatase-like HAD superfamily hydrolase